jgi:hypothetical protein
MPDSHLIQAKTKENTFLPDGYVESLYAKYPTKLAQQELEGLFVNLREGRVYYSFDQENNLYQNKGREWGDLIVGADFNVNPMCAVVGTYHGGTLRVIDEIYLEDSNTFAMSDEIKKRYPNRAVTIIPDASGKARKTSATMSDVEIFKQAGFQVICRASNPAIMDRFNSVNSALHNRKLWIDDKCKYLQRDLMQVSHGKNPDNLTHISDALGYLVYHLMPLKPTYKSKLIKP